MAEVWKIARGGRACSVTGEAIAAGTPFYSALLENDDGFQRRDFSVDAWPEVDKSEFFSYWKSKGGEVRDDKKPQVDYEQLLAFFDSLDGAEDPRKRQFRYVLALILVRRRKLRLDDMNRTDDGDRLVVWDRRHVKNIEIISPEATKEDLIRIQERLNELFECDFEGEV